MADLWWDRLVTTVQPYAVLIKLFVTGALGADEFEVIFLRLYKFDPTNWPPDLFQVLETLFADVDAYSADDALRDKVGGLSIEELRERAGGALDRLKDLAS